MWIKVWANQAPIADRTADRDSHAAKRIDRAFEAAKVDLSMIIDGDAKVIQNGLFEQFDAPGGVIALAPHCRRVDAVHAPRRDIDIQIPRNADHRDRLGLRINRGDDHYIGAKTGGV